MLSINISELIWTIINFFLLYFLLKRFLFTPVCRLLDERQAKIDGGLNAEKEAQATVDRNRSRIDAEKAESRREANRILTEAEAEDEKNRAESIAAARSKAKEDLRRSEAELEQRGEQEETLLREKSGDLSALLSARILGQED